MGTLVRKDGADMPMGLYAADKKRIFQYKELMKDARLPGLLKNEPSLKTKIRNTIELLKIQDISGCITGSCLLDEDFDEWESVPDVDVFVYSAEELVNACAILQHKLGMKPGTGTERSCKQEEWKLSRLRKTGASKKCPVTTHKFFCEGVIVNVSFKKEGNKPINSMLGVLGSFDMSIIMKGYDIKGMFYLDLRAGDPRVATPNLLRDHDCVMWNVAKWVRQFDRVIKYYSRGFDTRPMARFYLEMINQCIEQGCLFDSDPSKQAFDNFAEEFTAMAERIAGWLDEHEED